MLPSCARYQSARRWGCSDRSYSGGHTKGKGEGKGEEAAKGEGEGGVGSWWWHRSEGGRGWRQ